MVQPIPIQQEYLHWYGITYSIDGSTYTNTTGVFTLVPSGTYNVTAENASGCISSGTSVTINAAPGAPAAPTASATLQPTCNIPTGTITITAPMGSGITYSIDGSTYANTTGVFTLVPSGTYNVTAENAAGCISSGTSVTINAAPGAPAAPTASATLQPTCNVPTGTITITAPMGSGITYSIDGSTYTNTTGVFTLVPSGTYTVTAKNAAGCISAGTPITINSSPVLPAIPTVTFTQPTCIVSYQSGNTFNLVSPGSYTVTAENAAGCISLGTSVTINAAPATPSTPTATLIQPTCTTATGKITVTSPTGIGMTYSIGGAYQSGATFNTLSPGSYTITAKNANGCFSSGDIVTILTQPPTPATPVTILTQTGCTVSTGTITITSPLGSGITYSIGGAYQSGNTFNLVSPGTYTVTAENPNGCISNGTIITILAQPLTPAAIAGADRAVCLNISTQIGAASDPGSTYIWSSFPAGFASTSANPTVTPLVNTTYTVVETITATGCQNSNSVTVTVNPLPIASTITAGGATTFCAGNSVILSGNNGGIWSNGATTSSITVITSGDYYVTNTNNCGSITSNHITVTVNPLPIASIISASGATTFCECSCTNVILSGNNGGIWSNGIVAPSITVYSSGDYYVTNTNAFCSITSNHIIVTANPKPLAITGNNAAFCVGNSVSLGTSAISGHTYIWTPATGLSSSTISNPVASPTVTTTYSLTEYIIATGCQKTNSVTITVNQLPAATTGSNVAICIGNSVILGASSTSGDTYIWTPSTGLSSAIISNPVASPIVTTTYTLTETNTATGCQKTNSVTVTVNPLPNATVGNNATICNGNSVALGTTSISGHTYSWTPITGLSSSIISNPVASPSGTTAYTLTETITLTGCQKSHSVTVTVNPLPSAMIISANGPTTFCEGNNVMLSGNNGGLWSTGATTPSITVSTSNDYYASNTNSCGTATSNHILVTVNPLPTATTGGNTDICIGNSVTLGAPSLPGHTYLWIPSTGLSSSTIANPVASPTVSTSYLLIETITATSCQKMNTVTVNVDNAPNIITEPVNQSSCVGSSVSFSVTATGTGLSYQWRKGTVNLISTGNISGANSAVLTINPVSISDVASDYNVVVTGACLQNETSINVSLSIGIATIIYEPDNQTACIGNSVSFSVFATGIGLSYHWRKGSVNLINGGNISGAHSATLTINPVSFLDAASDYNVVISGICSQNVTSDNVSLTVNSCCLIVTDAITHGNALCPMMSDGWVSVLLDISSLGSPFTISLSPTVPALPATIIPGTPYLITGLAAGNYIINISSANGICVETHNITIENTQQGCCFTDIDTCNCIHKIISDITYNSDVIWNGKYYIDDNVIVTVSNGAVLDITTLDVVFGRCGNQFGVQAL
ncbi:MAG: hypothetical protein NTW49_06080 [Bacteroidia bacterium]|nr:hypothetical protein [Bacteroidia bacterium]